MREGERASEEQERGERESDPSHLSRGAFPSRLPTPSPRPTTRPSPHHRCVPSVYVCPHAGSLTGVPEAGGRAARACRRDRKKQGRASSMGAVCARAVPTPGRRGAHARHDPAYPSSQWLHQGEGRPPWGGGAGLWADRRAPGAGAGGGGARDHLGRGRPLDALGAERAGRPRAGPHARHPRPHTPPGEGARRWRWGWPCARVRARRHSSPLKAAGGGGKEEKKSTRRASPPPPRGGRTPPPLTPLFPSSPVPHAGPTHNTPRPVPAAACNTMGVDDEHGPAVGDDFVYSSGLTSAGEGERGGEAEGARGCRKARETPRRFLFFSSSASPSHLTPRRRPTSPIPHPPPPPTHRGRAPAGGARPQ